MGDHFVMAFPNRFKNGLRVGRHGQSRRFGVVSIGEMRTVAADLFEQLNDLRVFLLAQDGQFERQLLAVTEQLVLAPLEYKDEHGKVETKQLPQIL